MHAMSKNSSVFVQLFTQSHDDQKQRYGPKNPLRHYCDGRDMVQQFKIYRDKAPDEISRDSIRQAIGPRGFRFVCHDILTPPSCEDQIMPPPIQRRNAQIAITTKQKFRPLFFSDINPNAAPTPAIKMISQFSHPSKGMKPTIAKTRAMSPTRNAIMFATDRLWLVFSAVASHPRFPRSPSTVQHPKATGYPYILMLCNCGSSNVFVPHVVQLHTRR